MGFDPRPIAFKPSRPTDYPKDAVASTALGATACSHSMFTDMVFYNVRVTDIMWSSFFLVPVHVICMVPYVTMQIT